MSSQRVVVNVDGQPISLSNLDKALFEDGTTKAELLSYYSEVGGVMLPHLQDRCLTRLRFPEGTKAPGFFEKNAPSGAPPWLQTQNVVGSTGSVNYVVGGDLPGLLYLANLASIEFHTPQWRVPRPRPDQLDRDSEPPLADRLMIDLDPGEGVTTAQSALAALMVGAHLAELDLVAYPKTSGNKGLQLVAPIAPTDSRQVFEFARSLAASLRAQSPHIFTDSMSRDARVSLVLLDYAQNLAARNTISVYSVRGLASPRVSTPLTWDEVADASAGAPLSFTMSDTLQRISDHGDLWAEVVTGSTAHSLPESLG